MIDALTENFLFSKDKHPTTLQEAAEMCRADALTQSVTTAADRSAVAKVETAQMHRLGFPNLDVTIGADGHMRTVSHKNHARQQHDWGSVDRTRVKQPPVNLEPITDNSFNKS